MSLSADKKKKSSSKDSKSKSSSSKTAGSKSDKSEKTEKKKKATISEPKAADASDFDARILFNRYDRQHSGMINAEDFKTMWREANRQVRFASVDQNKSDLLFEAGVIFSRFEDGNGYLSKSGFEKLVREFPQVLRQPKDPADRQPQAEAGGGQEHDTISSVPKEIVSGLLLTHYDETAGVPISRSAVEHHKAMGNAISPLSESYKVRYDRLRQLLTSKLLPRREHLLQLRRQLQNVSVEVASVKRNIERETIEDTDQILDRLRNIESMRQSSIKHQVRVLIQTSSDLA